MSSPPPNSLSRLNGNILLLALIWTALVLVSLAMGNRMIEQDMRQLALTQAKVAFNKDLLYRRWNSLLGGIYAEIKEGLAPNPYLDIPERDIATPGGRRLTMVNPAYMTRMVHEMEAREDGLRGHLTSLYPLRPDNAPDEWEAKALRLFLEGKASEHSEVVRMDGRLYLRYMRSLVTEQQCLLCHAGQGYQLGQPRGGLTVAVPLSLFEPVSHKVRTNLALALLLAWLLGLGGLLVARQRLATRLRERLAAEEALRRHQERLEEMVASRTRSLAQATDDLKDEVAMRREAQEVQARQNRALWLLKRCDQELIRAGEEKTLVLAMCRLLVEQGGYRLAWVGYRRDDPARSVEVVASFGPDQGYLESLELSWDEESPGGRGPTGRTISTGQPQVSRVEDSAYAPWREAARQRGFSASLALPLADPAGTYGVLCLYSADPEAFDQEETDLLAELAGDLAFGINALRARDQLDQAHQALARAKDSLEETVTARTKELRQANARLEEEVRERRLAQDDLTKARLAAEAASRAKSEFLANMSHELRTPMNAIMGMTDLALLSSLSPEQRDYLETAKLSAQGLMDLLNDLLDLSKIEAGRLRLEEVDYDLRDLVESTAKSLAIKAHEKDLELTVQVSPGLPAFLRGDPHRLRQVLVNLVGNAIKFTERGEVGIAVQAEDEGQGPCLRFSVRDTGIGIEPEALPRIFERFTQADGSFSRRYGGTGLGTSISLQLVELMGGRLWAESVPDQGSVFHFSLPLRPGQAPASAPSLSPERLKGLKALVVDDHATNRRILRELFQAWGLQSLEAADGPQALEMVRRGIDQGAVPDLAVIDGQMPGMSGPVLARGLRALPALERMPLVMLTSVDAADLNHLREMAQPAAWISKPVRQRELLESLLRVLGHLEPACPTAEAGQDCPVPPPAGGGLRILLAEDNPFNQKLALALLTRAGHQVTLAEDGQAAVDLWRLGGIDLVVMDVQMPRMDGLEATRQIRRLEMAMGGHVPIVAVTAHARPEDRERCLRAGMDAYLAKPLQPEEFHAALRALAPGSPAPAGHHPATGEADGPEIPLLDLKRLEGGLGLEPEDLRLLCRAFLDDLPGLLEPCLRAMEGERAEELRQAAHTLKGVALNLGATALAQAARALEDASRLGGQILARPALDRVLELADQTSQALAAWLESGNDA